MGDACSNFVVKTFLTLLGWYIAVYVVFCFFVDPRDYNDAMGVSALFITIIHTIIRIVRAYRRASAVEPDDYLESE